MISKWLHLLMELWAKIMDIDREFVLSGSSKQTTKMVETVTGNNTYMLISSFNLEDKFAEFGVTSYIVTKNYFKNNKR